MFTFKTTLVATTLLAVGVLCCHSAEARPVRYGPGSGPANPFANYKGFAQVPRQTGSPSMTGGRRAGNVSQPNTGAYRCVPNVGLVGADGVCPD